MEPATDLVALARRALASSGKRVRTLHEGGARMIAKRLGPPARHWFTRLPTRRTMAAIAGFALPALIPDLEAAAWRPDFEWRRIQALAAAGVRVPRVLAHAPDVIVLEDAGVDVARCIETWPATTRWRELGRLADDLARFHRAGHWHGAAQVKNVAVDADGGFRRFDFEENGGMLLPLPIIQTADLLQFLNTIALAGPIGEEESDELLSNLVGRYFAKNPNEDVWVTLRRGLPWLRCGLAVTSVAGPRSRKGIRRAQIEARVLARILHPGRRARAPVEIR